jgi:lysozyme
MKTSAAGRAAISRREDNKLKAYKDSVGILTIGVGHTTSAGPPKVTAGMTITAAESDDILSRDLAKFENAVNNSVKVPLSQNQFDALVSLAFNIGSAAFAKSTLVRKLNGGDVQGAADAFLNWNKAGGKVLAGLTNRRQQERAQFLAGKPASAKKPSPAPLLAIVPKPAPAPSPATDSSIIEQAQRRLTELNYNPGNADGRIGPLTGGAIRVFRADHGLPDGDSIDADFMTALAVAQPRQMVAARANATTAQVAAVVPEANVHWWNKIGAGILGGGAAAGGAVDYIAPATGYLQPVRDFLGDIPTWAWVAGIVVIAFVLYESSAYGAKKAADAYRSGDRR